MHVLTATGTISLHRGNMFGSEFKIYDEGANMSRKKSTKFDEGRQELGMIIFVSLAQPGLRCPWAVPT